MFDTEFNNEPEQAVEPTEEAEEEEQGGEGEASKPLTPEQIAELRQKADGYDALLPEFTRRSQRLTELEGGDKGEQKEEKKEEKLPSYHDPDWKPKDYNDLRAAIMEAEQQGETRALKRLEEKEAQMQQANQQLDDFVANAKKSDPTFDEQEFYRFVNEKGFRVETVDDLNVALGVYSEIPRSGGKGTREGDERIAGNTAGQKGQDFSDLRASGGDIQDVASAALHRIKG